ncbi:paraquat-inducible protein A [Ameyamaea chiangmaiensis]|uniref:Paraquat-inducible protein A n=2 Tax=Ameyamaea chiangmaiensis TaxID=442969 RepID=A0A850PAT9_9PROT|nr:paraquat-inducible protein A [Ameyamaea chiangmaiensis]NVN39032.1 paraquat-inducible protein A [Ameyamaea chiangmaiensis]
MRSIIRSMSSRAFHSFLRFAVRMAAVPPTASMRVVEGLMECPCCGHLVEIEEIAPGFVLACERCGQVLVRRRRTSPLATPAAFCISSAAIYLALLTSSLMTLDVYGRERRVSLFSGPLELIHEGWGEIGVLVALATVVLPGVVIACLGAILYAARRRSLPAWAPILLIWYERLRPWSMVEVYVLGVFVAYTKLVDMAHVDVDAGVYLVGALMVTMAATDSTLDTERIWQHRRLRDLPCGSITASSIRRGGLYPVGRLAACTSCGTLGEFQVEVPESAALGSCPRCASTIRNRKADSLSRTTALLITALICYLPANIMPVMTFNKIGQGGGHTILEGVVELWQGDMIPLALLVFFASIVVPVFKIVSLAVMVFTTWRGSAWALAGRSRLYRFVDIIGRWSMIDVFMISILVAVVRFNALANIEANGGVVCFAAVVVLTIFAAYTFDPRSMWDAAGQNGPERSRDLTRARQTLRLGPADGADGDGMETVSR